jgi:hypothetical protein
LVEFLQNLGRAERLSGCGGHQKAGRQAVVSGSSFTGLSGCRDGFLKIDPEEPPAVAG